MQNNNNKFVAVVRFLQSFQGTQNTAKDYDFWCNQAVKENDVVVVDTRHGLQLARVVGIKSDAPCSSSLKWVVCVVDLAEHQRRLEIERKKALIQQHMEERLQQVAQLERYRAVAAYDPDMAKLLEQYRQLTEEAESKTLVINMQVDPEDFQPTTQEPEVIEHAPEYAEKDLPVSATVPKRRAPGN